MGELNSAVSGPKATLSGVDLHAPNGLHYLLAFHRGLFGDALMEAGEGGAGGGTGGTNAGGGNEPEGGDQGKQGQLVPQTEVDRIVRERVARERAKYSDYDDLKAKAAGSQTLEDRLATLEGELGSARAAALRSDIAAQHGISAADRDLFLTGTDETTLTAQAKRLAGREEDRKKQGNVAPKEGATPNPGAANSEDRQFVRGLFGRTD